LKTSRVLGIGIMIIQLVSVVGFTAGFHTILEVYNTAISGGTGGGTEIEMTDPVVIPYSVSPRNRGYLEARLTVTLSLVAEGAEVIATESREATIPPGEQASLDLELTMPLSTAQMYLGEGSNAEWVLELRITTLYDLVSFSNIITMSGDAQ
jgi:hypothetical protein